IVYFGSWDGFLYALDAKSGQPVWGHETGNRIFSSPALAGGVVYIGSTDGYTYALEAR
ncbi:MAG: PQQ-like beta-propeller repeat protein, partial [Gemmatimonadetes bacterium]|nr:PQQ-like beta-propeller repeat protein [Gemmatimonadota bacterium]